MSRHQFVVLGLGGFGETIATELARLGNDVLGIDQDEHKVDHLADAITHAVVANVSDEKVLHDLNLKDYDAAVVAIGENVESSILATLTLKSIGVKQVWVKALTQQHHRILAKLGADKIIHPEYEMGLRVAQTLHYPMIDNYMDVGDDKFIVEISVGEALDNQQIQQVIISANIDVQVLMVRRKDQDFLLPEVDPAIMTLAQKDRVLLLGRRTELTKLASYL